MFILFASIKILLAIGTFLFFYKYCFLLWSKLYYYKRQGVTILPGAWRPLIGNLPELAAYDNFRDASEPLPIIFKWILAHFIDPEDRTSFRVENHKAVLINIFGKLVMIIPDKDIA